MAAAGRQELRHYVLQVTVLLDCRRWALAAALHILHDARGSIADDHCSISALPEQQRAQQQRHVQAGAPAELQRHTRMLHGIWHQVRMRKWPILHIGADKCGGSLSANEFSNRDLQTDASLLYSWNPFVNMSWLNSSYD